MTDSLYISTVHLNSPNRIMQWDLLLTGVIVVTSLRAKIYCDHQYSGYAGAQDEHTGH